MPTIINSQASTKFTPINMKSIYNKDGANLSIEELSNEFLVGKDYALIGKNVIRGIPFELGESESKNVLFIKDEALTFNFDKPVTANYIVFIHTTVPKRTTPDDDGITRPARGNVLLGDKVADYELLYSDETVQSVPIRRRFAIGEMQKNWGDECFECVPVSKLVAVPTVSERMAAGETPREFFGNSQTRIGGDSPGLAANYWIYALENENPDKPINGIRFVPSDGALLVFGMSVTMLKENPLRWGRRKKALLTLPEDITAGRPNEFGRYPGLGIDLGQIISVTNKLDYDNQNWEQSYNNKPGTRLENQVIVEYCAHPDACFTVGEEKQLSFPVSIGEEIDNDGFSLKPISPAEQKVTIRIVMADSKKQVAVKLHIHGEEGEYLAPVDRHRIPNPFWFEDYSVDHIANGSHFCTYVDGETDVKLPLGNVYIEVFKGFEIKPIRRVYTVTPETEEIVIEVEKLLPWREKGWVSADTHVHFLSPNSALLEGAGEGVNVVNLLASQWGELFTNIGDFDGKTTHGSKEAGGEGEYLVRVGTENRQHVLGHISLCGYNGRMITPVTTGGPDESALGDAVEVTLSQWAEQCRRQGGIVVLPHFPNPRCENAAALVLNRIDAVEMTSWGNYYGGIDPYSLSDWYRYLNCGYFVAAVGGTDKMSANTAVGTVRTYALIEDDEFTYDNWKEAVRSGKTFVTYGPLMEFTVEGKQMGSYIELPSTGGTLDVEWELSTLTIPLSKAELVVNGETQEVVSLSDTPDEAKGSFSVKMDKSGWLALRVRGGYEDKNEVITAHSSPIMVQVEGSSNFSEADAITILEQIEGAIAFIDTIATRAQAEAYKAVKMTLTSAHRALHNRMHQSGIYHNHSPIDKHEHPHHE